jgi:hypothetical protein
VRGGRLRIRVGRHSRTLARAGQGRHGTLRSRHHQPLEQERERSSVT